MTGSKPARTRLATGLTAGAVAAVPPIALADLAPLELVALAGAVLAGLAALAYLGRYGPRFGPRHLLDVALPLAALLLLALSLFDPLDLPDRVRLVTHPLLGLAAATGLWGLARLPGTDRIYWVAGLVAGLAVGALTALWTASSLVLLAPTVATLLAWRTVREVPDPIRPDNDPLDPYVPWATVEAARPWPGWLGLPLRAPATLAYLVGTWAAMLAWGEETSGGLGLDTGRFEPWLYEIPELSQAPMEAAVSLVTAPFLNHDLVQLVYVTALLILFVLVFEAREGTVRAVGVFLLAGLAGALAAGVLLHGLIALVPDVGWVEHAWERTWSGGSAGAFGLMGAFAARARRPAPLMGFFVFWELNVGLWYLRSYTPAFHLTALAVGYVLARRVWPSPARASGGGLTS